MQQYKTIIQGRLEFGTQKSYDSVTKMFNQRLETYYKTDVFFKFEDIFNEEELSLEIPRYVGQVSEKAFRGTTSLLAYCAQFAIAGSIRGWLINEGDILHYTVMEPTGDKGAVQSFVKGRELVKVKGKEKEAISALTMAIEKYDRHAQAYERRAKVNFLMKNHHDAMRDYNKCITIDPTIPTAYYGKAKLHMMKEEWTEAIENLEESIKKSIAHQPIYWKSRKLKAECHIQLKEWDKAAFDLNLFTKRTFRDDDPNKFWQRWAFYQLGLVHLMQEQYLEAIKDLDKAQSFDDVADNISEADILTLRGEAKLKAGKNGYAKDLKDASAQGSVRAANLLKRV
ncbi:MAG: hypothetical protein LC107_11015 [Chitinophagales bacterium]|nr:hypothetical protein [Chitinophagales bacterium]